MVDQLRDLMEEVSIDSSDAYQPDLAEVVQRGRRHLMIARLKQGLTVVAGVSVLLVTLPMIELGSTPSRREIALGPGRAGRIVFSQSTELTGERAAVSFLTPEGSISALTVGDALDIAPSWSPEGGVVFSREMGKGHAALVAIDGSGNGLRTLTEGNTFDTAPAWSPDGLRIAFSRGNSAGAPRSIYLLTASTGEVVRLTSGPGSDDFPTWSPDGDAVAFSRSLDGDSDLLVLNLGTNALTAISSGPEHDSDPDWSPDGSTIAFVRRSAQAFNIFTMPVKGGPERVLAASSEDQGGPSWAPDGRSIAYFQRVQTGNEDPRPEFDLFAVGSDGKAIVRLTELVQPTFPYPDWGP